MKGRIRNFSFCSFSHVLNNNVMLKSQWEKSGLFLGSTDFGERGKKKKLDE